MNDYPINQPLPPITRDAPDELLQEALRRDPALLGRAQVAATNAWRAARLLPLHGIMSRADAIWTVLVARSRAAQGEPAALRASLAAGDTMRAIVDASPAHRQAIADQPHLAPAFSGPPRRAAMMAYPALAAFQALEDADAAAITARQEVLRAQQRAAYEAARPGVLVKALRERGIAIELDRGKLTVSATAALSDAERAEAAAVKAGIVEILTAEAAAAAEAARRTVLA